MIKKLLLIIFSAPIFAFSQFAVGHTTITFNDPARTGGTGTGGGPGRQIQTEIYYPSATAGDNLPVFEESAGTTILLSAVPLAVFMLSVAPLSLIKLTLVGRAAN